MSDLSEVKCYMGFFAAPVALVMSKLSRNAPFSYFEQRVFSVCVLAFLELFLCM